MFASTRTVHNCEYRYPVGTRSPASRDMIIWVGLGGAAKQKLKGGELPKKLGGGGWTQNAGGSGQPKKAERGGGGEASVGPSERAEQVGQIWNCRDLK